MQSQPCFDGCGRLRGNERTNSISMSLPRIGRRYLEKTKGDFSRLVTEKRSGSRLESASDPANEAAREGAGGIAKGQRGQIFHTDKDAAAFARVITLCERVGELGPVQVELLEHHRKPSIADRLNQVLAPDPERAVDAP